MQLTIGAHEVHLWLLDPRSLAAESFGSRLSADEVGRARRFLFERDRRLYCSARGLARAALSTCAPDVAPAEWRFDTNEHGKPEVAFPQCDLRFNVSHTHGQVACVVTREIECGVDVDLVDVRAGLRLLAEAVLTPVEQASLARLPESARADRFFRHWTLKEAYSKARGLGMSLPFEALEVDPTSTPIGLRLYPPVTDDPNCWQLEQWRLGANYWLAIAVRRGMHGDYRLVEHHCDRHG